LFLPRVVSDDDPVVVPGDVVGAKVGGLVGAIVGCVSVGDESPNTPDRTVLASVVYSSFSCVVVVDTIEDVGDAV
jgi:uncharacterized membrane protein